MAAPRMRLIVPGSQKEALPGAQTMGNVDPNERTEITVVLRPRTSGAGAPSAEAAAEEAMALGRQLPEHRHYLTRAELAARRGADPKAAAKVEAFAQEHHLTVVELSLPKRIIRLAGTLANLTAAFQANLQKARVGNRMVRMRTGGISIPEELQDSILAVFGFDDRPAAQPHSRRLERTQEKPADNAAPSHPLPPGTFTPLEIARLYNFPTGLDGAGQCIALIELNDYAPDHHATGTGFSLPDLKAYFTFLGLPVPDVTAIGVASNGGIGANLPGHDSRADEEVMLDIQVAGAVAPRAKIAVYFALGTDDGLLAAIKAALHDDLRKPSVISISWGFAEDFQTEQARNAYREALIDACNLGVTVCCSAGDLGSSGLVPANQGDPPHQDGHPHVQFPASLPFALSCGGTKLLAAGTTITSEVVWNEAGATGGGVSNCFPRPAYQSKAQVPPSPLGNVGRGVPDVAGDADPFSGYRVMSVGGHLGVTGGTSAVAALWAGLIALLNQRLARGKKSVGFLNPLLYELAPETGAFRDIVDGNNDVENLGKYQAGPGWDPCTGLGTPDGSKLLKALGG